MKKIHLAGILMLGFMLLVFAGCQKKLTGTGYVYDQETRKPLEGALVEAYLDHPSPDARFMRTLTSNDGSYYVFTQPYSCSGTCPNIVVEIGKTGYKTAFKENPNNDTTYLVKSTP